MADASEVRSITTPETIGSGRSVRISLDSAGSVLKDCERVQLISDLARGKDMILSVAGKQRNFGKVTEMSGKTIDEWTTSGSVYALYAGKEEGTKSSDMLYRIVCEQVLPSTSPSIRDMRKSTYWIQVYT